jgi:hypothetical protein
MKKIIALLVFSISIAITGQTNYEQGMQEALGLWGQHKKTEAINLFERIASAEQNNWIPYYYAAQIEITSSFGLTDENLLGAKLKKGQEYLDQAKSVSKNNAEILILQALLYTSWVTYDGATYGRKYSNKITKLYKKANKLTPQNPRAISCQAEWNIGSAKFLGKDTQPFCKDIEKSLDLFVTFELPSPFYPNWGEDRAKTILANCKSY